MRWPYPYKVLITTSGIGSRLNDVTKTLNKALVEVDGKPVLSHIIDSYPEEIPLVVTLGYLSDQIKTFISKNYPNRKVEYAVVDKYEGPGTSAGYSILKAKNLLQCPFIFHACDTIVTQPIPRPDINWTGGNQMTSVAKDVITKNFRTHWIENGVLTKVQDTGADDYHFVHIGLTGVRDYISFWKCLSGLYKDNPNNSSLTDTHVINKMIEKGYPFKSIEFDPWLDTGNPNTLKATKRYFSTQSKTLVKNKSISSKIKNFVLDVDGVLTTGQFMYSVEGKVMKVFGPDDSDALNLIKDEFNIIFVTGDKRGFEISKKRIVDDMKFTLRLVSTYDRANWIKDHFDLSETVYMGDGMLDVIVFSKVAYSIAPANAFMKTKLSANFVTASKGAEGAVAEACIHLMEKFRSPINFEAHDFSKGVGIWKHK